jgi:hypothetical protein
MINLLGGGAGPWGCMPSRTHSSFASVSSDERSVVGHSEDDPAIFYLHLPTYVLTRIGTAGLPTARRAMDTPNWIESLATTKQKY